MKTFQKRSKSRWTANKHTHIKIYHRTIACIFTCFTFCTAVDVDFTKTDADIFTI